MLLPPLVYKRQSQDEAMQAGAHIDPSQALIAFPKVISAAQGCGSPSVMSYALNIGNMASLAVAIERPSGASVSHAVCYV